MNRDGFTSNVRCEATAKSSDRSGRSHKRKSGPHPSEVFSGFKTTVDLSHSIISKYNIGSEMERKMNQDSELRKSILTALRHINTEFPNAKLSSFIDREMEDPETWIPVIEISVEYETVDGYSTIKDKVRQIVRGSEIGDNIVYSRVKRRS